MVPLELPSLFWIVRLAGRLHPLAVHFPVALLVTAYGLDMIRWWRRSGPAAETVRLLTLLGTAAAVTAALLGWVLVLVEGYEGTDVQRHQWLGTATAFLSLVTLWLQRGAESPTGRWPYRLSVVVTLAVLTAAGHLGAMLTLGEDYLLEVWPGSEPSAGGEGATLLAELEGESTAMSEDQARRLNLEVRGIFAHQCYRCHSSDRHEGGLALDDSARVFAGGESGPVILPGEPDRSELVRRIALPRDHEDAMPEKRKALSPDEIALIRLWIARGAPWADAEFRVFPEAELALSAPSIPSGTSGGSAHPIDRIVGAYLEANGASAPARIDDRTFARRVFLDVVGLVPSPEELQTFLDDPRADRRIRLVDTLLARRHDYAQHWLSFWNDLLRNDYSGTGFITGGRKTVTEWLYEALVTNTRYEAMVRELVAPDERSDGFVRGIQWRGAVNASQRTEMQAAQNVAQVFLGVNLKCASCHNSFVSNLTLDQAYGMANVFADSPLEIHRCDKPTGRLARSAFLYRAIGSIDETLPRRERQAQLAGLITSEANGRFYRTMVNRIWARLFGRGLVEPTDAMDNAPWSQELLDWLAADFRASGTDLQHLLRTILLSETYQMPSVAVERMADLANERFVFAGPVRRRLTAEQFVDAVGRIAAPVYSAIAFDPFDRGEQADWVWFDAEENDRDVLPPPGTAHFRRTFELDAVPDGAEVIATADDRFTLYLNGEEVLRGETWHEVRRANVGRRLVRGRNVIAVAGVNDGKVPNPAGLLLHLRIELPNRRQVTVTTDGDWLAADREPGEGWRQVSFEDSDWKPVRRLGGFRNNRHWGRLPSFTHSPSETATVTPESTPFIRASLVYNDDFLKALGRPTRENVVTRRADQATLLEALELTNGAFLSEAVARGARAWLARHPNDPSGLAEAVFVAALGRSPERDEVRAARKLLGDRPGTEQVADLLWSVLLLPEFQLIL